VDSILTFWKRDRAAVAPPKHLTYRDARELTVCPKCGWPMPRNKLVCAYCKSDLIASRPAPSEARLPSRFGPSQRVQSISETVSRWI
jgi:hypothetical protein